MIKDKKLHRILIIEDNAGDFSIVEDFLTEQILNPLIVHAGNFKQASAILTGDHVFDVILLDLTLPDKNGQDLINEMLHIALLCPIIILTGYDDIDFSAHSISQGISDYLIKDDLNAAIVYKSITYAIERKKTISHLEESEKRYSDLFHLSPQPMWVYESGNFHFIDVNNAAMKHYGYNLVEFLSMTMADLFSYDDMPGMNDNKGNSETAGRNFSQGIFRHKKKDGEFIDVEVNSNFILFKGEKAVLNLAIDITEKSRHIAAIEMQNEKLREIAWIQSHIVRAPLARMMGIASLIRGQKMVSPEQLSLLETFMESATELDNIIKDISKKTERVNIKFN
jgi:PAS domain S-box-containing protein